MEQQKLLAEAEARRAPAPSAPQFQVLSQAVAWLLLILLLILLLDRVVFLCLRLLRPGLHWLVPVVELARGLTPISSS